MQDHPFVCCIGINGSGKSTLCKEYQDQGYTLTNTGSYTRRLIWRLLDWEPPTEVVYRDFKNSTIIDTNHNFPAISGLSLLQNTDEAFKDIFGRDAIAKLWLDEITTLLKSGPVACDRIAHPEEVLVAMVAGAKFIYCDYQSEFATGNSDHINERLANRIKALKKYKHKDFIEYKDLAEVCLSFYDDRPESNTTNLLIPSITLLNP